MVLSLPSPPGLRGLDTEVVCDAVRSPTAGEAHPDNAPLDTFRAPARRGVRAGGAIREKVPGSIAVGPFLRGRGRALEPFRGAAQVPALLHDQDRQTATSFRGEGCVSVSHENLRGQDLSVVTHILHGGSRFTSPVHNVPRQYI